MPGDQYDIRIHETVQAPGQADMYRIGRGIHPHPRGGAETHLVLHPRMVTGRGPEDHSGSGEVRSGYPAEREDSDD
ncbi:hypothetical protein GCM10010425_84780 [Streptomyces spororaveus]